MRADGRVRACAGAALLLLLLLLLLLVGEFPISAQGPRVERVATTIRVGEGEAREFSFSSLVENWSSRPVPDLDDVDLVSFSVNVAPGGAQLPD